MYVEVVGRQDMNIEITGYSIIKKTVFGRVLRSISTNGCLVIMRGKEAGYECTVVKIKPGAKMINN